MNTLLNKIVILDGYTTNPGDLSWHQFEEFGTVSVYDRTPKEEILPRLKGAQIAFTNKTPVSRETLSMLPQLKYLGALSTGYNTIDTEAAKDFGITVTNIPEYATYATAQMTIALLLELTNHVGSHDRAVHEGAWIASKDFSFTQGRLTELWNKTLGLVGYGRIAGRTAVIARALGMRVLAASRTIEENLSAGKITSLSSDENGVFYAAFDTLLEQSDIISLHCPLTDKTRGIINKSAIDRMKDGVLLINTSRGPVLEELDVAQALYSGKIAGAALDVLSREPPGADNPLLSAPNCIITPHIAWAPKETRQRLIDTAYENLRCFLSGNPQNMVSL